MIYNISKKTKFLISALFFLISCENNSEPVNCLDVIINVADQKGRYNDKVFTGTCNAFSVSGNLLEKRKFKNGVMSGEQIGYYESGATRYLGNKKKGEIHGSYIGYHENGNKQAEGRFKMGYYDGKWLFYDENGKLTETKTYLRGKEIK